MEIITYYLNLFQEYRLYHSGGVYKKFLHSSFKFRMLFYLDIYLGLFISIPILGMNATSVVIIILFHAKLIILCYFESTQTDFSATSDHSKFARIDSTLCNYINSWWEYSFCVENVVWQYTLSTKSSTEDDYNSYSHFIVIIFSGSRCVESRPNPYQSGASS